MYKPIQSPVKIPS